MEYDSFSGLMAIRTQWVSFRYHMEAAPLRATNPTNNELNFEYFADLVLNGYSIYKMRE